MSFLQPLMLFGLPLIALPIVIHLINQYRYRTIEWGAMYFLLTANKMSRGYARIRQWLILLLRTLAIAGLIFAISRPLASGWMRLAAPGNIDTTIILLDRSPSMQQQGTRAGVTKLDSAREQLVNSLSLLESNRWILIDSANNEPIEINSPQQLADHLETQPVSASADFPAMLETVHDYLRDNRPSRTEVWMCSDLKEHDWDPGSARWDVLRSAFLELPFPVQFHLLAYGLSDSENRSLRMTSVSVHDTSTSQELRLSLSIKQTDENPETVRIPVQLELNGTMTEIPVDITGTETELINYSVSLEGQPEKGWGRISIPADANEADNEFYFVYDQPPPLQTVIVTETPEQAQPLELAAGISPNEQVESKVTVITPSQIDQIDWDPAALVLWQAPLPTDGTAAILDALMKQERRIVFFPPETETDAEFAGLSWGEWRDSGEVHQVSTWLQDQDLLANVQSGAALPVGELKVNRYRELEGERITLATLDTGDALLCRALTDLPNVYFCTTRPISADSTFANNGVVLYVMIQRALAEGAASLSSARQLIAGEVSQAEALSWNRLSQSEAALSSNLNIQAGTYEAEETLVGINRSPGEDRPDVVPDDQVAGLFQDLPFDRIDEEVGRESALMREIWPTFLLVMIIMLIGEAILCIPKRPIPEVATSSVAKGMAA
ncbi:MAG: BatA domain-containing protein [Planctomycetaceae bacterium]|nr:BatA domain-containing protein [Planctomycetaceae bacterium]